MVTLLRWSGIFGALFMWGVFFCVAGGCCKGQYVARTEQQITRAPLVSLALHTDVEFTQRERVLIAEAAREINRQTGGQVVVTLTSDVDFTNRAMLPPEAEWYLIRVSSLQLLTLDRDMTLKLGVTYVAARSVYLVWDRLGSDEQFRHTTQHEIYHALGLDHVPGGLILAEFGAWDWRESPQCVNAKDAVAISKKLGLDPTLFDLRCTKKDLALLGGSR